jgi:hypothetical protein
MLYPAHDYHGLTVTSVAEERRFYPRLGGEIALADFTGYMKSMRLAHPRLIDVAVPANLHCGRPENETRLAADPTWALLHYSFAEAGATTWHRSASAKNRKRAMIKPPPGNWRRLYCRSIRA